MRVPAANLIGEEGRGFRGIMHNFNNERLMLAGQARKRADFFLVRARARARSRRLSLRF